MSSRNVSPNIFAYFLFKNSASNFTSDADAAKTLSI